MLRRSLLLAASGLVAAPSLVRGAMVRRSGGSASTPTGPATITAPTGTLTNAYGLWEWGPVYLPGPGGVPPHFHLVQLNGKPCWGEFPIQGVQTLTLESDGNIYGKTRDIQYYSWSEYYWLFCCSPDLEVAPLPGLPTYSPPYTPSADGTQITGGTGSITTQDGVWTFGDESPSGSGWYKTKLNGIRAAAGLSGFSHMRVDAFGQCFQRIGDQARWVVWEGNRFQNTAGPTSGPIPTNVILTPPVNDPPASAPVGTFITAVSVTTSNGSPFAGTLAIHSDDLPGALVLSPSTTTGPNDVTAVSPVVGGGWGYSVVATQNGCTFERPSAINAS
jgi:hypothetical protein